MTATTAGDATVTRADTWRRRRARVLVVASSMGAGHVTAARVLQRRAAAQGARVRVLDLLKLPPWHQGDAVRALYRLLISRTPALYDEIMRLWADHPRAFERITSLGEAGYVRALHQELAEFRPDVVVSTYNLAGQMLGRLRSRGDISIPVVAYVTDAGAHPYWVARGADLHLAPLAVTAERLRDLGADNVRVVTPLVEVPKMRPTREKARQRLGLPSGARIVLVNGGSWGVGHVIDAAAALRGSGVRTHVLCGSSKRLYEQVNRIDDCHPVGWTDDVAGWLAAADVLVDNAGGTTCWEALAARRAVVLHQPLPGHGRLNADALRAAGLVTVTTTPVALRQAVTSPPTLPAASPFEGPDATEAVMRAAA